MVPIESVRDVSQNLDLLSTVVTSVSVVREKFVATVEFSSLQKEATGPALFATVKCK